jgi:predicted transposase YbfD/YdcC
MLSTLAVSADQPDPTDPDNGDGVSHGGGGDDEGESAEPAMRPAFAVDGKAERGTIDTDGRMVHLLQAFAHTAGVTLAQRPVATKSNEITGFAPLLDVHRAPDGHRLAGWVATMDALHTQVAHAEYCHDNSIDFIMIAKDNQPALFAKLDTIDWQQVPVTHRVEDHRHGRREVRTIQVTKAPDGLAIPHVDQAFLIERGTMRPERRNGRTTMVETAVAVLGVTTLTAKKSTSAHIATYVRGHWSVENSSHHVRDTTYREDASRIRRPGKPQIMATVRNTAIGLIRLNGRTAIASTNRLLRYDLHRIADLFNLNLQPEYGP